MNTDLRVLPDPSALAGAAASAVAHALRDAAHAHGSAAIALAGGNTPRALYRALAREHHDDVPWPLVHVFWGDERDVPLDDPRSNYHMAREELLEGLPIPAKQVHPLPVGASDLELAAVAYEQTLRAYFGRAAYQRPSWPVFDLALLGMGEDGHTASLFPHSPALEEQRRWVLPASAPVEPRARLTLTLPALTHARALFVVVAGATKAEPLRRALAEAPDAGCPASLLRTGPAPVTWWADAAAALLVG